MVRRVEMQSLPEYISLETKQVLSLRARKIELAPNSVGRLKGPKELVGTDRVRHRYKV
jgi:hypothetical protein